MLGKSVTMNVSAMAELTTVAKLVDHLQGLIANIGQNDNDPASYDVFPDELIALINKDMTLDERITPKIDALPAKNKSEIRNVLLTGVTGKFGPWILRGLIKNAHIEKVYCIVRSTVGGKRGGEKVRLRGVIESLKLEKEVDMSKIETISGDITEKMFGLRKNEWEELAEKIDAIVHCAVKGNLLDPYTRFNKEGGTKGLDIRTPNVLGDLPINLY
jgi:male sterility protein